MIHTTKDGTEIELKDLELSHLKNILALHKRKAKTGVTIVNGGGSCPEDFWYIEEDIYGQEVLNFFNHNLYFEELKRRDKKEKEIIYWTKKDGTRVDVDKMTHQHLKNVLKMIIKNARKSHTISPFTDSYIEQQIDDSDADFIWGDQII